MITNLFAFLLAAVPGVHAVAGAQTATATVPASSAPATASDQKPSLRGKTVATVKSRAQAAWLHDNPDPAKWQIQCQLVYQVRSRIPKRVCATVGEWEAIGFTAQRDAKQANDKGQISD